MASETLTEDERAFSETFAVGLLVAITLLMLLSVGIYVLAIDADEDESNTVEFEYDYNDGGSLLVRYTQGQNLTASAVILEAGTTEATWAELAGTTTNDTLQPGAAVQLSSNNAWGEPVTGATTLNIHVERDGQRTQVSNWSS